MKWSVEHKVLVGFTVALVILAAIGGLAYQSTVSFMHASSKATHSHETITALEEIFSLTNQAETRQRIYLISGDERHLAPRRAYIDRIHILLGKVQDASGGDSARQALLHRLDDHINRRLALLEEVLKVRREKGFAQARLKLMAGDGEREMDAIHEAIQQLVKGETARLQQWVDASRENSDRMLTIFFVALVSVAIFFGVLFLFIVREMAERKQAEEQRTLLLNNLEKANEELQLHRRRLEERVAVRTEQFEKQVSILTSANSNLSDMLAECRQAGSALKKNADQLADLYHNAPCSYYSLDPDSVFVQINDTGLKWLGRTREEVVGKMRFIDLLTPESAKIFLESYERIKVSGWMRGLQLEIAREDGATLSVLVNAIAIKDAAGRFVMSRSVMFDIADR